MAFNLIGLIDLDRELWREDAKLDTTVGHARDELRTAERNLATMMDKVCPLRCINDYEVYIVLGHGQWPPCC